MEEHKVVAKVLGKNITDLPKDLFIPPDALEVFLENFEGPLDLLLYLIKKQNIDILDIPVAIITEQYMSYIEVMKLLKLELAAEYLVMAALLTEIKSRMLLPKPKYVEDDEEDPRAQLIKRLQEYERFKQVAQELDEIPRGERDFFPAIVAIESSAIEKKLINDPVLNKQDLLLAMQRVLEFAKNFAHIDVTMENLSVKDKILYILKIINDSETQICFYDLLIKSEAKIGIIVTFMALLEVIKEYSFELIQNESFSPIYITRLDS